MCKNIFNTEYNIFFFNLSKKRISVKTIIFINSDEKNKKVLKKKNHIIEKNILRHKKKKNLKENLFVIVYDLQAVFSCTRGEAFEFYYLFKLSIYNYIIDDLKGNIDVKCYVWYEDSMK